MARPARERMPPIGSWIDVAGEIAFVGLGWGGPVAFLVGNESGLPMRSLLWAPKAARVLTPQEVQARGLPAVPALTGVPPQPVPGTWGAWRFDPALSWLTEGSADPDVAQAYVLGDDLELAWGALRLRGCEGQRCWGSLATDLFGQGPVYQVRTPRAPGGDAMLPVAWLDGTPLPATILEAAAPRNR